MKKIIFYCSLIMLCVIVTPTEVQAQCPMCRMSAESNLKGGGSAGKGLNAGILYMLSMPYVIVAGIGFAFWRYRKGKDEEMTYDEE